MCITGADPGFFLGRGALVSCSTSTPINHIIIHGSHHLSSHWLKAYS